MTTIKEIVDEISSYIADADKLERIMEAFREMDRTKVHGMLSVSVITPEYEKLKALIEE